MSNKVTRFILRLQGFIDRLLSDDHSVSLKRFVSVCAFILFVIVTVVSLIKTLTAENVDLLKTIVKSLMAIISVGILGVAATDIFQKKGDDV